MARITFRLYKFLRRVLFNLFGESIRQNRLVWEFKKQIFPLVRPDIVQVQGHSMMLDKQDVLQLSIHGVYEPFITHFIQQYIQPRQTVLDIGANIGYYTLIFARLVGPPGHVFAFEPEPVTFSLLEKNIRLNGYQNVMLNRQAVLDTGGKITFYRSLNNNGDHKIYMDTYPSCEIEVEAVALDAYFSDDIPQIDFIKMDIQGAEGKAIAGMTELLRNNPRLILMTEFWPVGLRKSGTSPESYLSMLANRGFDIYRTDKELLIPVDAEWVVACILNERAPHNLICFRGY